MIKLALTSFILHVIHIILGTRDPSSAYVEMMLHHSIVLFKLPFNRDPIHQTLSKERNKESLTK